MRKYYVAKTNYAYPSIRIYDAYTDNLFLMKRYVMQFEAILSNMSKVRLRISFDDILDITEVYAPNEDSLLSELFLLSTGNRLWTINDHTSDNVIVTNNLLYSDFIESIITRPDIIYSYNKTFHNFSNKYVWVYFKKYFRKDVFDNIEPILIKVYESYELLSEFISENGDSLITSRRNDCGLWDILNEYTVFKRFIEMGMISSIMTNILPFY